MRLPRPSIALCLVAVLGGAAALGQAPPQLERPTLTRSEATPAQRQWHIRSWRLDITGAPLDSIIETAYRLGANRLVAPDWVKTATFDISGMYPETATAQDMPAMLRALIEQRFRLRFHFETRPLPAYALVVSPTGHKLRPVVNDADRRNGPGQWVGTALFVATQAAGPVDRPILDRTGLQGDFRGVVSFAELEEMVRRQKDPQPFERLNDRLSHVGLLLEPTTIPTQMMVIDSIDSEPLGSN